MENIYQAISGVMGDIGAIAKDKTNTQQGFKYRGIDDVMNALSPVMVKHKMFVVPECIGQTREERLSAAGKTLLYSIVTVRFTFYAEDGTSVQATTIGEGMDSGDKATNKAMAIAFKYACFQAFCIPTIEMLDPDGESHELKPGERKPEAEPTDMSSISDKQEKRLFAIANAAGIDVGAVLKVLVHDYKKTSVKALSKAEYEEVCTRLQAPKQPTPNG